MSIRPIASRGAKESTFLRRIIAPVAASFARFRARVQPVLTQLHSYWQGLSARERKQVLSMAAVLLMVVIWLLFTKPAFDTLRYWENEMPRLRAQSAAVQDVLDDVGGFMPVHALQTQSAAEGVTSTLNDAGMQGAYQLHQKDADLLIEFTQAVESSQLVAWLMSVPTALGLAVTHVSLHRDKNSTDAQGGRTTATVTLTKNLRQAREGS